VRRSHCVEAELLVHLGEIDERKLYLDWSFSSMFAFCVGELGFSEDVTCNRINVARAARQMPVILETLRSGKVHLAGLRLLAPHLTTENQEQVLAEAAGKSKREIEEQVARLAPQPAVPTVVRKLPEPRNSASESPTFSFGIAVPAAPSESSPALAFAPPPAPRREERRPWLHRSPRTRSSSSSLGVARVTTSSAKRRICSGTGSRTGIWRPSSRRRSTCSSNR
jgi:hypothetical protein